MCRSSENSLRAESRLYSFYLQHLPQYWVLRTLTVIASASRYPETLRSGCWREVAVLTEISATGLGWNHSLGVIDIHIDA